MANYTTLEFEDEVSDFLKEMKSKLSEVKNGQKRYIGLLSSIVFRDVISHFKDEQGESGPWQQWSYSYRKQMNSKGRGSNKILQYNGRLRNSFQPTNVENTNKGIMWFNNAKTKSNYPYAWGHDTGDGKLPKRDFMWLSEKALEDISNQTLAFLLDEGI